MRRKPRRFGDTAEEALLIATTRWPTAIASEQVHDLASATTLNWEVFAALLKRHRVHLLALNALTAANISVPEVVDIAARDASRRMLHVIAELIRLTKVLESAGIAAATIKGPALSQQLYGRPDLRELHDLDLLVAPDAYRDAIRLLERAGYRRQDGPADDASDTVFAAWMTTDKDVAFLAPGETGVVELHHRLLPNPHMMREPRMAEATTRITVAGLFPVSTNGTDLRL